ncbi:hypothetical protein OXX80_000459 [Metschnikowia pulcherrima]
MSAIEDDTCDEQTYLIGGRRQSVLDQPLGSFRGPNTLHNFASSFTRAQSFAAHKLDADLHKKRSFFAGSRDSPQDELFDPDLMVASPHGERLSVLVPELNSLRQGGFSGHAGLSGLNEVFYQDDVATMLQSRSRRASSAANAIPIPTKRVFPAPSFSSVRSAMSVASTASQFGLKRVEDRDGNVITVVAGQSTAPQTILNSVNVLIGVGLLALPVGLLKGGWVLGLPLLIACCLTTCWSATLLSKALDKDRTMMTYADLGFAAYGKTAKLLISLLFSVDLLGSGVSLVLLFSDSLYALVGDETWTKTRFKLVAFAVLTPFTFMPLPVLSIFSLFGILATVSITVLVFCCGWLKSAAPGSLLDVMPTNLWPKSTPEFFIALGILMAPFGGHAIFPNLKSDMRHPEKFTKTLVTTYTITLLTDCSMAVIGFLMFGALCNNEVTSILLETAGYPAWIYPLISGLICIVPLAKTPLNAKPIISTLDALFGLDFVKEGESAGLQAFKNTSRFITRVFVNALFVGFAILFPEFDKIIGILGSSICFIICIILPCLFYLKLCKHEIRAFERFYVRAVVLVSTVLAALCTYATIAY